MTDYLPHDIDAADDARLQELQMEMRGQGYAIWWRLLELLWKNEGRLPYKPALLAYNIRWCTADEVERVITGFDLFVVQDGQFWSEGLLARLEARNTAGEERIERARRAGKASAKARGVTRDDPEPPENSTAKEQEFNASSTNVQRPLNSQSTNNTTLHNTTQHLSLSEGTPAREREGEDRERDLIFLRFFFKNFKDPAGEMERYWDNYAGQGWKTSKGAAIEDKVAYCSGWKPLDTSARFTRDALKWYENFYNDAAPDFKDPLKLLTDLTEIARDDDDQIVLRYTSKATAQKVANWRSSHGGYAAVAVQVTKKRQPTPNPLP